MTSMRGTRLHTTSSMMPGRRTAVGTSRRVAVAANPKRLEAARELSDLLVRDDEFEGHSLEMPPASPPSWPRPSMILLA